MTAHTTDTDHRSRTFTQELAGIARAFAPLFAIGLSLLPVHADADGARIVVEVGALRTSHGAVVGALFASDRGWTEEGHEVATCRADIHRGHATCVFDDVPPGTYAVAFMHDEDGDGHFDRDWIGIPQEGFGFSNDAAPRLGPPSFQSASFHHTAPETVVSTHTRYGI